MSGQCAPPCLAGAVCGGACRDVMRDRAHCGGCDHACPEGATCETGRCVSVAPDGSEGAFAPLEDVVLPAGIHRFTTITVAAGVRVTTTEDGVLDLRATGDVRIDGTIDLSGGSGGAHTRCFGNASGSGGGGTGVPLRAGVDGDVCSTSVPCGGSGGGGGLALAGSRGGLTVGGDGGRGGGGGGGWSGHLGSGSSFGSGGGGGGGGAAGGGGGAGGLCALSSGHIGAPGGHGGGPFGGLGATVTGAFGRGGRAGSFTAYHGGDGVAGRLCGAGRYAGGGGGGSIGGDAAFDLRVSRSFQPGSGGGGGGGDEGTGGGGGGGALRVASATRITVSAGGALLANGGSGSSAWCGGGSGGGGSGGVIVLSAPEVRALQGSAVSALGGLGGRGDLLGGAGGRGGLGRVRVSVDPSRCTLAATGSPTLRSCAPTPGRGVDGAAFVSVFPD